MNGTLRVLGAAADRVTADGLLQQAAVRALSAPTQRATVRRLVAQMADRSHGARVVFGYRLERGWSRARLARALAVHPATVWRWETDRVSVPVATVAYLERDLGVQAA